MTSIASFLRYDPVPVLQSAGDDALTYFVARDLLGTAVPPVDALWELPEVARIVRRQLPDGSWRPASGQAARPSGAGHPLAEAYRNLRILVDQYELTRAHPAVERAAEMVLAHQTPEGDLRGILASQYTPYYTGALMHLLIRAGYVDDPRIEAGFAWLLSVRQNDGGWVIGSPGMIGLGHLTAREANALTSDPGLPTAKSFDPSKPFSAAGTGMVLRAFAAHTHHRRTEAALMAADLLKSKLLRRDNWSSYQHPDNWVRFEFPFWWTNLVSALDTLSFLGLPAQDEDIRRGLDWLLEHQQPDGLWLPSYSRLHRQPCGEAARQAGLWVTLAACRVLGRFQQAAHRHDGIRQGSGDSGKGPTR